jgi:enterochelin esterase-like enzyme
MKHFLRLFAALALGALALGACGDKETPEEPEPQNLLDMLYPNGQEKKDFEIQSKAMKQTMKYSVWLPPKFDAAQAYPFLYLLHGAGDDNNSWLSNTTQYGMTHGGNAAEIAAKYVKTGGTPMIIVMPDAQLTFYMGDYETYMYEELMPKVESDYKFSGKRAVAGLSMGGFGTLYHALKYPSKYTYAYSMSPASSYDLFKSLVDSQTSKSVFPPITIEVGNQDTTVHTETEDNEARRCADYMTSQGLTVEYIPRDGGHTWDFWRACLPKALKKAGESFQ